MTMSSWVLDSRCSGNRKLGWQPPAGLRAKLRHRQVGEPLIAPCLRTPSFKTSSSR